jgi:hypothetical protein
MRMGVGQKKRHKWLNVTKSYFCQKADVQAVPTLGFLNFLPFSSSKKIIIFSFYKKVRK